MTKLEQRLCNLDKDTAMKVGAFMLCSLFNNPTLWMAEDRDEEQLAEIEKFLDRLEG